jgi:hypothetical protein
LTNANIARWGVAKTPRLLKYGPVGLIHTEKVGIKSKKPTAGAERFRAEPPLREK